VSMAVWSTGNPYKIGDNLIFSFPVTCENGKWTIVKGLDLSDDHSKKMIKETEQELSEERKVAFSD